MSTNTDTSKLIFTGSPTVWVMWLTETAKLSKIYLFSTHLNDIRNQTKQIESIVCVILMYESHALFSESKKKKTFEFCSIQYLFDASNRRMHNFPPRTSWSKISTLFKIKTQNKFVFLLIIIKKHIVLFNFINLRSNCWVERTNSFLLNIYRKIRHRQAACASWSRSMNLLMGQN